MHCRTTSGGADQLSTATGGRNPPTASRGKGNASAQQDFSSSNLYLLSAMQDAFNVTVCNTKPSTCVCILYALCATVFVYCVCLSLVHIDLGEEYRSMVSANANLVFVIAVQWKMPD